MNDTTRRYLDRYGPFVAIFAVLALVLTMAPSTSPDRTNSFAGTEFEDVGTGAGPGGTATEGASPVTPETGDVAPTGPVTEAPEQGAPAGDDGGGPAPTEGGAAPVPGEAAAPAVGEDCSRRAVLGEVYPCAPPWAGGDNGGATYQGVTADTVNVVFYKAKSNEVIDAALAQGGAATPPEQVDKFARTYINWLSKHGQLYGRKINLIIFQSQVDTAQGGSQATAHRAEAVKVAQEHKAFVVVGAADPDFMDEVTRRGVMCLCSVQSPDAFYRAHAPFIFTSFPTGGTTNSHITDYITKRMGPNTTADHAGPGVKGEKRVFGIVHPQEPYMAPNGVDLERRLKAAGIPVAVRIAYTSDVNTGAQQATNITQRLRSSGVTTVICVCDPVAPFFLLAAMSAQAYYPEHFISGYFYIDTDEAGQFYDQTQWEHAFGVSWIPVRGDYRKEPWYRVYKEETGDDIPVEHASGGSVVWGAMFYAFLTVERAGPQVNPRTAAEGLFSMKMPSLGPTSAQISFGPEDYGGVDDMAEVWWDKDGTSPVNGRKGTLRYANGGKRYLPGQWPAMPPSVGK